MFGEIGDIFGDTTDFFGNPSFGDAAEIFIPGVVEDVFDGGGLDDFGFLPDVVNGGGFTIPFGPTIGPNAPNPNSAPAPSNPVPGSCPVGFKPNPQAQNRSAMLRAPGSAPVPNCVPDTDITNPDTPMSGSGLDGNCNEIPREYPAPDGCIPDTSTETNPYFNAQREGCMEEWKLLETMETEIKARYEQLCMAREKFNQRQDRYGGVCGPYELLYGIEEMKDNEAKAKEKAKHDCLEEKGGPVSSGGCGCAHKTSGGCGCGCSGKHSHSTPKKDAEYKDPVKSACKRAVDESFKPPAKRLNRTCVLTQPRVYRTTILRKPANTVPPPPKVKKTVKKVVKKATKKAKVKRSCR